MKLGFGKLNAHARIPDLSQEKRRGIIPIVTPVPLEIQAGEKVELKTGLLVRVPEGYILNIQSSPSLLVHKGLEVLGPIFMTSEDKEEIKIPLYNTSNGQINLQSGMLVATALLVNIENVEIQEFIPEKQKAGRIQSKPPKGDSFKFEVSQ